MIPNYDGGLMSLRNIYDLGKFYKCKDAISADLIDNVY